MSLEYQIIIALLLFLCMFIILYIRKTIDFKKQLEKVNSLEKQKSELIGALDKKQESITPQKELKTDFVKAQIQKIETLEVELIKQKKRVVEAKSLAQDSSMIQYNFLSNVNHEIRTPLNSILVFAELLTQELQEKKYTKYATNILESGYKLLHLMNDVIELAKLETKEFESQTKAVAVKEFFEMIFNDYTVLARKKGLDYSIEIDDEMPISLMLDDNKVEDIVRNLIDNALKYTSSGYVKLMLKVESLNPQKNSVHIKIVLQDSGRGIESENINNIFKIFEQHQPTAKTQLQGSGIELSMNKKIAKLLNGDLSVTSKFTEGSIFSFDLYDVEIVLASADENIDESTIDFSLLCPQGAEIMVIDENELSRVTIEESFKNTTIKTHLFSEPHKALEFLKVQSVRLIFIDIDILSVDENALSKVIAKMSQADVISLTSTSIKNISFSSGGANIVGHLKKPISKAALFQLSLRELNNSHTRVTLNEGMTLGEDAFSKFNQELLKKFIQKHLKEVNILFYRAYKAKDLNEIKMFAQELLKVSLQAKITPFISFSNELLQEVKLFNIEAINSMLKEYESRVKRV